MLSRAVRTPRATQRFRLPHAHLHTPSTAPPHDHAPHPDHWTSTCIPHTAPRTYPAARRHPAPLSARPTALRPTRLAAHVSRLQVVTTPSPHEFRPATTTPGAAPGWPPGDTDLVATTLRAFLEASRDAEPPPCAPGSALARRSAAACSRWRRSVRRQEPAYASQGARRLVAATSTAKSSPRMWG